MTSLSYDYNISHDGDAVVMVSHRDPGDLKLGVDIMRESLPVGIPDIPEFAATIDDMVSRRQ